MEINMEKVAQECMKAINEKIRNLKKLNIVVAGKTGAGKRGRSGRFATACNSKPLSLAPPHPADAG